MKTKKVIIADRNKLFREGLKRILHNIGGVKIVGEARDGNEMLEMMKKTSADIAFLELNDPVSGTVKCTAVLHSLYPGLRIIGFSSYENHRYAEMMMQAGASGYLTKSSDNYQSFIDIINRPNVKH
ncbi:MAG: response regulator transcription factor [Bacteroidales bacterium]|nr:response regulator transcription factor [Bacteroidales bacterium]